MSKRRSATAKRRVAAAHFSLVVLFAFRFWVPLGGEVALAGSARAVALQRAVLSTDFVLELLNGVRGGGYFLFLFFTRTLLVASLRFVMLHSELSSPR